MRHQLQTKIQDLQAIIKQSQMQLSGTGIKPLEPVRNSMQPSVIEEKRRSKWYDGSKLEKQQLIKSVNGQKTHRINHFVSSLDPKNSEVMYDNGYIKQEGEGSNDSRNLPKLHKVDLTDTPNIIEGLTSLANQLFEEEFAISSLRNSKKKIVQKRPELGTQHKAQPIYDYSKHPVNKALKMSNELIMLANRLNQSIHDSM